MDIVDQGSGNYNKTDKFGVNLSLADERNDMVSGKRENQLEMLEFLAEHNLALPPAAIYRNLRFNHEVRYSKNTCDNYLDELSERGLVEKVDPKKLKELEAVPLSEDSNRRGYYRITEQGKTIVEQPELF